MSYQIIISPEISKTYEQLPPSERQPIEERLGMIAAAAEDAAQSPSKARRPHAKELAVVSAGTHRIFLADQWIEYRIQPEDRLLQLVDFGSWSMSPLARKAPFSARWHSSGQQEDGWDNEGGGSPPSPRQAP
ncbi:hypothetical protein [Myxococcus stipitatus]|uniref:hypothetical protein n=1 Tax=Myxococcus stipitatus TaxID=83455 RepID=UPI0030CCA9D3